MKPDYFDFQLTRDKFDYLLKESSSIARDDSILKAGKPYIVFWSVIETLDVTTIDFHSSETIDDYTYYGGFFNLSHCAPGSCKVCFTNPHYVSNNSNFTLNLKYYNDSWLVRRIF